MTWIRKRWLHLLFYIFVSLFLLVACQPSTEMPEEAVVSTLPEDTLVRNITIRQNSSFYDVNYGGCFPLYQEIPLRLEVEPEKNSTTLYDLKFDVVLKAYAEEENVKVTIVIHSEDGRFNNEQDDYILSPGEGIVRSFDILFYDTWYRTEDVEIIKFVRTEHLLEGQTNYCIEISTQLNGVKLSRLRG